MEQQVRPKPKLKKKGKVTNAQNAQVEHTFDFDLGATFGPAEAKEEDFDLDLGMANWQGKKGQAGSRTKAVGGGDPTGNAQMQQQTDPRTG